MSIPHEPDPVDVTEPEDLPPAPDDSPHPLAETPESAAAPESPTPPRRSGLDSHGRVKRTRAGTAWASAVALALLTILFVVFIVQNSQSVTVRFLWMDGKISAAAALLIAAVAGSLLVGIPAAVRIGQLRRSLRRNAESD